MAEHPVNMLMPHARRARSAAAFAREAKRSERVHHSYVEGGTDPGVINHPDQQRHVYVSKKKESPMGREGERRRGGGKQIMTISIKKKTECSTLKREAVPLQVGQRSGPPGAHSPAIAPSPINDPRAAAMSHGPIPAGLLQEFKSFIWQYPRRASCS